jgi:hypothetical protein
MTFMPSQEAPSKREIAEYLDNTELAGEDVQTKIEDDLQDIDTAVLAYQLWEGRGRPLWSDLDDWFNAERKLKTDGHRDPGVAAS